MDTRPKQTFLQRSQIDGQGANNKMLNITSYQRNVNQNYNETSPHTIQNGHHQKSINNKCWRRYCYTVGDNESWYKHHGEQHGGSLKI